MAELSQKIMNSFNLCNRKVKVVNDDYYDSLILSCEIMKPVTRWNYFFWGRGFPLSCNLKTSDAGKNRKKKSECYIRTIVRTLQNLLITYRYTSIWLTKYSVVTNYSQVLIFIKPSLKPLFR